MSYRIELGDEIIRAERVCKMLCGGRRHSLTTDATAPRGPTPTKLRVRTRIRADTADLVPPESVAYCGFGEEEEGTVSS
jgi:hypothetical protein